MKKIDHPQFIIESIYPLSLTYIDQSQAKRKIVFEELSKLQQEIFSYGQEYEDKALISELCKLDKTAFSEHGDELKKLYSNGFVAQTYL